MRQKRLKPNLAGAGPSVVRSASGAGSLLCVSINWVEVVVDNWSKLIKLALGDFVRHKDVAYAPHGLDKARLGRVGLDKLAQSRHLDIEAAVKRFKFPSA